MKVCIRCNEAKPLVNFIRNRSNADGKDTTCRHCRSIMLAEKYGVSSKRVRKVNYATRDAYYMQPHVKAKNRERARLHRSRMTPEQIEQKRIKIRKWRESSPRTTLGTALYLGLRRRPTKNPATTDDVMQLWHQQHGKCEVSGIPMTWRQGKVTGTTVSIDRVDPEKGYSADNVRLVCYAVNLFKGRMTDAEMLTMAHAIVDSMSKTSREPSWQPHIVSSEAA